MAKYIDADNALKVIYDYKEKHFKDRDEYPINYGTLVGFINQIRNIPSEDVVPVVKGQWVNGDPICPCCGEDKFKDLDADIWADWQPKYCPNCGARMRKEKE